MKLSILLASYNEAEYLPQAVESCRKLGLSDYEIVIGDDGSSDGSIQLIEKYAQEDPAHIRYFVQDRSDTSNLIASLRVSDLLFRAMEMATGDYLVILSGDDYFYETDFFAEGMAFLQKHPDHSAYVGSYDKVWQSRTSVHLHQQYPRALYWAGAYIHISAFLFRKSAVTDGIFLDRFCDDTGLSYSLAFAGDWKYTDEKVFAYRQRESSITHASDPLQLAIAELMLLQDTLNKGRLTKQSYARFCQPAWYVFTHREEAQAEKYKKYRDNCARYPNDILGQLLAYDQGGEKPGVDALLRKMKRCRAFYFTCLRLCGLWQKILPR